jgi:hypothetical protein
MKAICLGSATCKDADLDAAAMLGMVPGPDCMVIATNHAGKDWPGHLDHWVSLHPDLFPKWMDERTRAGRPPAGQLWTVPGRGMNLALPLMRAPNWAGSSGLLAVTVGIIVGAMPMVLCGIPLDLDMGHYDSPLVKWRDAGNYRKGWETHRAEMACVRSMSGWTMERLGVPTKEWIDEGWRHQ